MKEKLILILVFTTPLIWTPLTYEAFEFPKMMFVYLVAILLTANWLREKLPALSFDPPSGVRSRVENLIQNPASRPKFTLSRANGSKDKTIYTLISVFIISAIISTAFSTHPSVSLYGYYTRFNGGLLSVASYLVIFFTTVHLIKSKPNFVTRLIKAMLVSTALVSLYAIVQHFGLDPVHWVQNVQLRVFSTLGQPNWLASYMLLLLPLSGYCYLRRDGACPVSTTPIVIFLLQFTAFWFTYSLSGLLGFAVGTLVFVWWFRKLIKENLRKAAVLASGCLLIMLLFPGPIGIRVKENLNQFANIATNKNFQFSTRTENFANTRIAMAQENSQNTEATPAPPATADTGKIRLLVWKGSIKAWLSNPKRFLIGEGLETFAFIFPRFRPEALNTTSEWDFLYNKAHNEYINLLVNQGFFGLLAYLAIIIYAIKNAKTHWQKSLAVGLISLSISLFFGFNVVVTNLYLWVFLSLLYVET